MNFIIIPSTSFLNELMNVQIFTKYLLCFGHIQCHIFSFVLVSQKSKVARISPSTSQIKRFAYGSQRSECLLPVNLFHFCITNELSSTRRCSELCRRTFVITPYLPRIEAMWLNLNSPPAAISLRKCYLLSDNHFLMELVPGHGLLTTSCLYC